MELGTLGSMKKQNRALKDGCETLKYYFSSQKIGQNVKIRHNYHKNVKFTKCITASSIM
jgi:hypothetical protein